MPRYVYNVVYLDDTDRQVAWHMEPRHFAGSASDFARATLLGWLERHPEHAARLAVVNVWDADLDGVGVPGNVVAQLMNWEFDEGPFEPNQLYVSFSHYHVLSPDNRLLLDDPVLGFEGTDYRYGTPYGLIVPGVGPGLRIRAGHSYGWITLDVALRDSEPPADLTQWEAVEQVTIAPSGPVRVADQAGALQPQFPDLTGGRDVEHLAVRVSVRGRDSAEPLPGAANPRRSPLEHHFIEAWPVTAAAPHRVLKRDDVSRAYERRATDDQ